MPNFKVDLTRFAQMAFSGRAFLLAGQALEPSGPETILRLLRERGDATTTVTSLSDLCSGLDDTKPLDAIFSDISFDEVLGRLPEHIAQIPWSGVISSAIDQRLTDALSEQLSQSRRLHHVFPETGEVKHFQQRPNVLSILHLSRIRSETTTIGSIAVGPNLRRISRRFAPAILDRLAEMVGLGRVLCIAGISAHDLINFNTLIEVLRDFDTNNVYWFLTESDGINSDELREELPGIEVIESDLESSLADYLVDEGAAADAQARASETVDIGDLLVTVKSARKHQVIKFTAEELREFRPHLSILGDFTDTSVALHGTERKAEFVKFLSRPINLLDWSNIAQGCIFERDAYGKLYQEIHGRLSAIGKRRSITGGHQPIFLAGPPASGRSTGLEWLSLVLRVEKIFTVYLTSQGGSINITAIEKIIRLAESRGVPSCVVLADRLERSIVTALEQRLYGAGRRTVVVATAPKLPSSKKPPQSVRDLEEDDELGKDIDIDYALSAREKKAFSGFLELNGVTNSAEILRFTQNENFFATLYKIVPEARQNITRAIIDEFESLQTALRAFPHRKASDAEVSGSMADQLRQWLSEHHDQFVIETDEAEMPPPAGWTELAQKLPLVVMLFSRLGAPVSTDVLLSQFPHLISYYNPIIRQFEDYGLAFETPLDNQGRAAIEVVNQLVAKIIIDEVTGRDSAEQINILREVLLNFRWDPAAHRGDYVEQDELIQVLRSISPPKGALHSDYNRTQDLEVLAALYRQLRESCGFESSALMLTEGTLLRALGKTLNDPNQSLVRFRESKAVLGRAYDLVFERPASLARTAELGNILSANAATAGHMASAMAEISQDPLDSDVQRMTDQALEDATRSRAYQDTFHPLDIAFWANRDQLIRLQRHQEPDAFLEEQVRLLNNMASALDSASELEGMTQDQIQNYRDRCVELQARQGKVTFARELAEKEAEHKNFGGVCIIARDIAIDIGGGVIKNRESCAEALSYLRQFMPEIFDHETAATLMHRLWVGSQLGKRKLGDGLHSIGCNSKAWRELEEILHARERRNPLSPIPYVSFWKSVALAHQGDFTGARRTLELIQLNVTGFGYRRLNPLILIADENGGPLSFKGIVRRFEANDAITAFIPNLGFEVQVQPRYKGLASLLNVKKGDEVKLYIGLSYWRPMGVATDWEMTRG